MYYLTYTQYFSALLFKQFKYYSVKHSIRLMVVSIYMWILVS